MSDDLDPRLKSLFAQTAEHPADEAFVAAVSARTWRERPMASPIGDVAVSVLKALALAVAVGGASVAAQQGSQVIAPLITSSPIGFVTGLALAAAGAICVRALAPLAARRL